MATPDSRYSGPDGSRAFWRDMTVAFAHPDYREMKPVDALAQLYERHPRHSDRYD